MAQTPHAGVDNRRLKRHLRRQLRARRNSIDRATRVVADRRICANIASLPAYRRARNVATFLAFDGEPSLEWLHTHAQSRTKRFHVPVIRSARMQFAPLKSLSGLRSNRFGIREPQLRSRIETRRLDVVLVSLVGFDLDGNRLGMGGGFYDRHFGFLGTRRQFVRPRLIGVGYSLQQVAELPHDPWDVPLWGIVTETGFRRI